MDTEIVKIPEGRITYFLGKNKNVKARIEKQYSVELKVSKEGEIEIEGESADIFFCRNVIIAIGRGFEPRKAFRLFNDDYDFFLISLKEHLNSDKAIKRVKGRIIGEKGKMKMEIESATDSYVSVYGNTVAIISKFDALGYAKEAVFKLMNGAEHSVVFNYLGKIRKRLMADRLKG